MSGAPESSRRQRRLAALPLLAVALAGLAAAGFLALRPARARPAAAGTGIVSLSPSTTETLFALGLGGRVVGVSTACDWPPEARRLPKMGDYGGPAAESILAARPALVVYSGRGLEARLLEVRRAGIAVYSAPDESLEGIAAGFEELGRLAGAPRAGEKLAADFRAAFARAAARTAALAEAARPTVFIETWDSPLSTVGGDTFVDELIRAAGGRNVAGDLGRGYFSPPVETVLRRDPQVVILARMLPAGGSAAATLAARPGWADTAAVRSGRVWADLNPDWLLRPGPRLVEGLAALSARLDAVRGAPAR